MRLTLLTTAAVLAIATVASANADPSGAKPDFPATQSKIKMALNDTGNASGGTGVEESTESKGATNKQGKAGMPSSGAGSAQMNGANSSDQGGTGVKASAQGEGATNKSTQDPGAPMGSNTGASAGNASGGTGVETSSQGEGSKGKTSNE